MIRLGDTTIREGCINTVTSRRGVIFCGRAILVNIAAGVLVGVGDHVAVGVDVGVDIDVGVHVAVGVLVGADVGVVVAGVVSPGCIVKA